MMAVGRPVRDQLTGLPLADLLATEMNDRGLTLKRLVGMIRRSAAADGGYSRVHEQLLSKWRGGKLIPNLSHRRWLAMALQLPIDIVQAAAEAQQDLRAGKSNPREPLVAQRPVVNSILNLWPSPYSASISGTMSGDESGRRAFLCNLFRLAASLVGAGLVDPELLTRLHRAGSLNQATLDGLDAVGERYADALWGQPSGHVMSLAWGHYAQLRLLLSNSSPGQSQQIKRQAAKMALLLGRVARHLDNRGNALAYWRIAEDLAAEAEDGMLVATICIDRTVYFSHSNALSALDDAANRIDVASAPYLEAWLRTRQAREEASDGKEAEAYRRLEQADSVIANAQVRPTGYFAGWSSRWLASYEANCAIRLGQHRRAATLLEQLLERSKPAGYHRLSLLRDLAVSYVQQSEVARACECLTKAIDASIDLELTEQFQQIDQIRRSYLEAWRTVPEVQRLDEQLLTASQGVF
jgi:tetratricopeptide (TPR) repeat protein